MHQGRLQDDDVVSVRDMRKVGHVRIPHYVRGKIGRIVQFCGTYLNPEDLAVGNTAGPAVNLYRVEFPMRHLWPDDAHPTGDKLVIEIYQHWLEPA